ncbi:hypothetical protein Tco_1351893 [Tanacetum coccineum]
MPATPSPATVCINLQEIWCRVLVTPGSVVVTPGSVVVTPGSVVVTPGSVVVTTGSVVVTPGSVVVTPGSVVVTPGSVITTGSILVTPGSVIVYFLILSETRNSTEMGEKALASDLMQEGRDRERDEAEREKDEREREEREEEERVCLHRGTIGDVAQVKITRFKNHESSRIKDKDFRTNSDIQDLPSKISSLSREIVSKLSR